MKTYIIDAFNLLHKIKSLKNSYTPQSDLINFIRKNKLTGSINNRVIIVFDGHPTDENYVENKYEIVFSNNSTADDIIKERVSIIKNKHDVVVVSNDNEIKNKAKIEGATSLSINDFIRIKSNKISEDDELSESAKTAITEEMKKYFLKK